MAVKDISGANILRMDRVSDMRDVQWGTMLATGTGNQALILWDSGEQELVSGTDLKAERKGLRK